MHFLNLLVWWALLLVIGWVAWPITWRLFPGLADRGYSLTKPVGLLLLGLGVWWLGFVTYSVLSILAVGFVLAAIAYWAYRQRSEEMIAWFREHWVKALIIELFFTALFLLFLFFRTYNAEIVGTEKFMDLAFLNALSRTPSLPPYDPWMAGQTFFISYYYFGYFLMSILLKLSAAPPAVGFNLALGSLFALAGLAAFGIFYQLVRRWWLAFTGWAALFLLGNLDGFRQLLTTHTLENFNWWTPSRVIPDTINEFPFFSFLLGDMHPHMLSIPFVLLTVAFALNHLLDEAPNVAVTAPGRGLRYSLWGLAIGALGFLNSWDLPTAYALALGVFGLQQYRFEPQLKFWPWKDLLLAQGVILGFASLPYLPFYWFFSSQAKGIGWTTQNTQVHEFLLLFGVFLFLLLTFLAARYHQWFVALLTRTEAPAAEKKRSFCPQCGVKVREGKRICGNCGTHLTVAANGDDDRDPLRRPVTDLPAGIRSLLLFLLQPVAYLRQPQADRKVLVWGAALFVVLAAGVFKSPFLGIVLALWMATGLLLLARPDRTETTFALLLLFMAWSLIAGCEVLHINDTFTPPLDRMNTVFKFYYQAWFLMGIAAIYGAFWTFKYSFKNANWRLAWLVPLVCLVVASLVYPYASIKVKTNSFLNPCTLDGSDYLNNSFAPDRLGIEWLRAQVQGNPVVLEATGAEYTDFARVSTFTGLPTVLGWAGHELQWRGNYDEPGRRIPDIDALYGSSDVEAAKVLLDKYHVQWVFVGTLERQKYTAEALKKFGAFMQTAFEQPGVTIYRR